MKKKIANSPHHRKLSMARRTNSGLIPSSVVIKNRWKTLNRLGKGAFGEIYAGIEINTCDEVAIKCEKAESSKLFLKLETFALRKLQSSPHVVRFVSSGRQENFNFLIMERLGENIAVLRKRAQGQRFSMSTTLKTCIQMIDCIESIHELGYIHRDIKPSNFCIGTKQKSGRIFLIDFNLARRYTFSSGAIRPPRKKAGFRGTARYASYNSHRHFELSRRDDMWSLFYILIELVTGSLPWKGMRDKDKIGELKEEYSKNFLLVQNMAKEFFLIMKHIKSLKYEDQPQYDYMKQLLYQLYNQEGFSPQNPMDWEDQNHFKSKTRRHSFTEMNMEENIFKKRSGTLGGTGMAGGSALMNIKRMNKPARRHSVHPIITTKEDMHQKILEKNRKIIELNAANRRGSFVETSKATYEYSSEPEEEEEEESDGEKSTEEFGEEEDDGRGEEEEEDSIRGKESAKSDQRDRRKHKSRGKSHERNNESNRVFFSANYNTEKGWRPKCCVIS